MTRAEFIQAYAKQSNLSGEWAQLGFIEIVGGWKRVALPCSCGSDSCSGWGMVSIEHIDHHLQFDAPDYLREAYVKALHDRGGI